MSLPTIELKIDLSLELRDTFILPCLHFEISQGQSKSHGLLSESSQSLIIYLIDHSFTEAISSPNPPLNYQTH